jgi:hypothetical protein
MSASNKPARTDVAITMGREMTAVTSVETMGEMSTTGIITGMTADIVTVDKIIITGIPPPVTEVIPVIGKTIIAGIVQVIGTVITMAVTTITTMSDSFSPVMDIFTMGIGIPAIVRTGTLKVLRRGWY